MKILITNDDGIYAKGLERLVAVAQRFGEVYVVAPDNQCSAMSMRLTLRKPMKLVKYDYPIENVIAYSLGGTPVDCVKVALSHIMKEKPDIVFSGINFGYNTGYDTLYSGTIGAAMEALLQGVPAIAFSAEANGCYEVVDEYIFQIIKELISNPPEKNEIYSVNFPGCKLSELKGIVEDVSLSDKQIYVDHYYEETLPDGTITIEERGDLTDSSLFTEGSDVHTVYNNQIAIGKIKCNVL